MASASIEARVRELADREAIRELARRYVKIDGEWKFRSRKPTLRCLVPRREGWAAGRDDPMNPGGPPGMAGRAPAGERPRGE